MPRLPNLSARQIIARLKGHGFIVDHITGSHYILFNTEGNRRVTVAYHSKNLSKATLASILKQAGLTADDF